MPNPTLHRQRDRAAQVQQRYNEQVAVIHGDPDLSSDGRQRKLAAAYAKATRDLSALAEAERAQLASRRAALEREVYSAPYSVRADAAYAISAHDASDRAAQLKTPAKAADLLRRAEGDREWLLARAVARRAMDASYTAVGVRR